MPPVETDVFEFAFVVRLDRDAHGYLRKFRQETPILETPRSPVISVEELIYGSWQTVVEDVVRGSSSSDERSGEVSKVINSLAQWVFPRGAKLALKNQGDGRPPSPSALERSKPRLKQFLLTASDYAKFYVYALELREELLVPECANRRVIAPLAVGLVSRSPHLQLPRVALAGIATEADARGFLGEWTPRKRQRVLGLLGYSLEMRVPESTETAALWYPANDDKVEIQTRGGSDVSLDALVKPLFDLFSVSTVLTMLNVLLLEQKLVLVSFRWSPSFLMVLCEGLRALMYPFDWHHVYLPAHPELDTLAQLRELRTIEVPAPLIAALRVLEPRNEASMRSLGDVFPDIHFVDVDGGLLIPASIRVDGRTGDLPAMPRRLASTVTGRLKTEVAGGVPPSEATAREAWAERLSEYEGWEVCDEARICRRVMRRVTRVSKTTATATTTATVVQSNPWFSGFLASKVQSHESVPGLALMGKTEDAEVAVQSAFLEGFVRVLFLYGEFVQATSEAGTFVGGERSFQGDEFLKELTKNSFHGFQTADVDWLKDFVATQTWDLFLRTVARSERGSLFDEACALFKTLSRSPKHKKNLKESFGEELSALVLQHKTPSNILIGPRFFVGSGSTPRSAVLAEIRSSAAIAALLKQLDALLQGKIAGCHLLFRVLEYFSGNGASVDPAAVPVDAPVPQSRGPAAVLSNGWQAGGFRVCCRISETSDFDALCRACGYATGFWRCLRLAQWHLSDSQTCSFACPTCKAVVTPSFRTKDGRRAALAGFRALLADPGDFQIGLRLLAGTTVQAGGRTFSFEDLMRDFVGNCFSLSSSACSDVSDDVSDSRFARQLSGRSSIDARTAQTRAVERIRDYRKKVRKPSEDPVVTVRVVLASKSGVSSPPPAPPREPRPQTAAPRRN